MTKFYKLLLLRRIIKKIAQSFNRLKAKEANQRKRILNAFKLFMIFKFRIY